jgi:hypothetical protein
VTSTPGESTADTSILGTDIEPANKSRMSVLQMGNGKRKVIETDRKEEQVSDRDMSELEAPPPANKVPKGA